jgi:hydroxyacylglutathione hydrolase
MLKIEALPAFSDNYIWLLQDLDKQLCAVVDPGDAAPVQAWLDAHPDWRLTDIVITHHHHDHVGGVEQLRARHAAKVYGPAAENIPSRDIGLTNGQRIEVLGHTLTVIEVPGHTLGHIAYFHADDTAPWLLSGDTLFAAGCGRLFEGTPGQMYDSLRQLAALPPHTLVYCAHEYTLSNVRFAQAVEPDNQFIAERLEQVTKRREAGQITLPSDLQTELDTNPFLRSAVPAVAASAAKHCGATLETPEAVFAAVRAWKDRF